MNEKAIKEQPKLVVSGHPDSEVVCSLQMDSETKKAWILVSLRSVMKPAVQNHKKVSADFEGAKLEYEVRAAAEHLAAYQCQVFRDPHNPAKVADAAVEALKEILEKAARANHKVIVDMKAK